MHVIERKVAWKAYTDKQIDELEKISSDYKDFISDNKTERECAASAIALAEAAGYKNLDDLVAAGTKIGPGDRIYSSVRGKSVILVELGERPLTEGMNLLAAHIDCPRLDVKQNPLFEKEGLAFLDTHYYGGIKKYHWVGLPLALHGVICKKDGTKVTVKIGENAGDPVFFISDLLIHFSHDLMNKPASEVIEGEILDIICGNRPAILDENDKDNKNPVSTYLVQLMADAYGIEEDDLASAELEVVPAGPARDLGLDRSMILGHGHDDRACSYPILRAQLEIPHTPTRTAMTILTDKEEIGSIGATGMESLFIEDTLSEILYLAGYGDSHLALRRCLKNTQALSCDVAAAYDPSFPNVFETKNAAFMGRGLVVTKFTGRGGKSGANDADAEFVALVRRVLDDANVAWQTAELGRVDAGGGGTVAFTLARYGMQVIDAGVAVLSMHAPWELISKADLYASYRGYVAWLAHA